MQIPQITNIDPLERYWSKAIGKSPLPTYSVISLTAIELLACDAAKACTKLTRIHNAHTSSSND